MSIIESLMKTELVTVKADETVAHAAWSMARNGVGAVLVLEGESLMGVLSERDVVTRVVAEGLEPTETRVAEVATAQLATADVSASIRECAERIHAEGIRHLPIRDFFAYVVEGLDKLVQHGTYQKALADGADPYDHLGGSYGN